MSLAEACAPKLFVEVTSLPRERHFEEPLRDTTSWPVYVAIVLLQAEHHLQAHAIYRKRFQR
jgi:hypothetical protein